MNGKKYIPDRGDLVWLDFPKGIGHEQGGKRPALVLSPRAYNVSSRLMIACPVTSRIKGYKHEVPLAQGKIVGVVLADHLKSLSWRDRSLKYINKVDSATYQLVCDVVTALIQIE